MERIDQPQPKFVAAQVGISMQISFGIMQNERAGLHVGFHMDQLRERSAFTSGD
jgi:hypothetical protein